MKTFKIRASAVAQYDILIHANTKSEAEEKFRKNCIAGEIIPSGVNFQKINAAPASSGEHAPEKNALPIEIWDRMDRYDYYIKLGYDVAKAEPSRGKYLYSRKGKMIDEYVRRLEGMTENECVREYCPKNKIFGTDDRNKIREILVQSIINDARAYAENLNAEFNEERIRKNAERAVFRMPKTIDRIIAEDRKKIDGFIGKRLKEYNKQSKGSIDSLDRFLQKQGIKLPRDALDKLRHKIRK